MRSLRAPVGNACHTSCPYVVTSSEKSCFGLRDLFWFSSVVSQQFARRTAKDAAHETMPISNGTFRVPSRSERNRPTAQLKLSSASPLKRDHRMWKAEHAFRISSTPETEVAYQLSLLFGWRSRLAGSSACSGAHSPLQRSTLDPIKVRNSGENANVIMAVKLRRCERKPKIARARKERAKSKRRNELK